MPSYDATSAGTTISGMTVNPTTATNTYVWPYPQTWYYSYPQYTFYPSPQPCPNCGYCPHCGQATKPKKGKRK